MIIIKPAIIYLFLIFSEEANKTGGPMNHIPIMPMPIPSFQRNWQTLKSSVLGQNNSLQEKSTKSDDNSIVVENSDQNMLMDQEDSSELNSPSISYQNTAPDKEVPKKLFHQKSPENCDKNCEVTANSDCTPTITNISPVKLRITVKSEKDLMETSKSVQDIEKPSKSVLELEKSSKNVPELIQKPSESVQELVQKPSKSVLELEKSSKSVSELEKTSKSVPELEKTSKSVPELVQKPSETVQELQKPSYNLELDLDPMEESNIQDPDLDQINVVDQIIATRKTAQ